MPNFNLSTNFLNNIPPVTRHLLIINVLCWIACIALKKEGVDLLATFSLHYWDCSAFNPVQLFTYMFLHAPYPNITHILFNMFALYMFGRVLEMYWGPKFFLFFYIMTGLGAGVIQELTWMYDLQPFLSQFENISLPIYTEDQQMLYTESDVSAYLDDELSCLQTVGASGAIFGILTAFAMKFPNQPVYIYFIPVPIKAKYVMIGTAVLELFLGVSSISDGIAHFAHLGGALVGLILVLWWNKFYIPNR
ncbi:MAG: rhomboid family intramembrane serine protease [Paludibacteraceae bacterium]|nr:rhomboid family intramembrane serine protease [Paludibacteraceae bacterium]